MKKLLVLVFAIAIILAGCGKEEANPKAVLPPGEQKLTEMGAREIKAVTTNQPTYDRMEIEDRGKAYSVEILPDRKISVETDFKGQIILLSPQGEELLQVSDKNKYYFPAKEGKYYVWFKNNAVPSQYYIIIKTFNKASFHADSDELPGTKISQDGIITGVVDSKTDPTDYYSLSVLSDYDVRVYHDNPNIDVTILNKYNEETPVLIKKPTSLFIMDAQEIYLKVKAKDGKVGIPYEINIKREKNNL